MLFLLVRSILMVRLHFSSAEFKSMILDATLPNPFLSDSIHPAGDLANKLSTSSFFILWNIERKKIQIRWIGCDYCSVEKQKAHEKKINEISLSSRSSYLYVCCNHTFYVHTKHTITKWFWKEETANRKTQSAIFPCMLQCDRYRHHVLRHFTSAARVMTGILVFYCFRMISSIIVIARGIALCVA